MARPDESARRESFNSLVAEGIYSDDFDHPPMLKDFVQRSLAQHAPTVGDAPLRIIDCGCGTGLWLDFTTTQLSADREALIACGFDLADGMVEVAKRRLPQAHLQQGDLLNPASYQFDAAPDGFDLVFAFDVVQQLPRQLQYAAVELMAQQLAPGGVALIFDHDRASPYGRKMGWKKFLTQYLRLPLLPRYYCDARYPPLAKFAEQLNAAGDVHAQLIADTVSPKMVLILTKQDDL